jgi:hypothetical protein
LAGFSHFGVISGEKRGEAAAEKGFKEKGPNMDGAQTGVFN